MVIETANQSHSQALLELVFSSGPRTLAAMLGGSAQGADTALKFLSSAISQPYGQFGYRHHTVIVDSNQSVVAAGCCWGQTPKPGFRQATMDSLIGHFGMLETMAVIERSLQVAKIIPGPQSDELCLGHIAVIQAFRRKGLASMLLEHFEAVAYKQAKAALVLDVEASNSNALSLYRDYGFTEVGYTEPDEQGQAIGLTAHWHMRKALV